MTRRLVALTLTFVFVLAPVATVVCEASCTRDAVSAMAGAHRCCHGRPPGKAPSVHAVALLCDHPAEMPSGTGAPQQLAGTPAASPFAVSLSAPALQGAQVRTRLTPPVPLATTTQLRV